MNANRSSPGISLVVVLVVLSALGFRADGGSGTPVDPPRAAATELGGEVPAFEGPSVRGAWTTDGDPGTGQPIAAAANAVRLGGEVFVDVDGDGRYDLDAGERGMAGLWVYLLADNGNGLPDGGDRVIGSATTGEGGRFVFAGLAEGRYWVALPAESFQPGQPWYRWTSSLESTPAPDPNDDVDGDDNGTLAVGVLSSAPDILSGVIHLRIGQEPIDDGDGPNGNQTLDFGLVPPR